MVQVVLYKIGEISSKFEVTTGVHQGCVLSPILFNLFMDRIMCETLDKVKGGLQNRWWPIHELWCVKLMGHIRSKLLHADDLALLSTSNSELQH